MQKGMLLPCPREPRPRSAAHRTARTAFTRPIARQPRSQDTGCLRPAAPGPVAAAAARLPPQPQRPRSAARLAAACSHTRGLHAAIATIETKRPRPKSLHADTQRQEQRRPLAPTHPCRHASGSCPTCWLRQFACELLLRGDQAPCCMAATPLPTESRGACEHSPICCFAAAAAAAAQAKAAHQAAAPGGVVHLARDRQELSTSGHCAERIEAKPAALPVTSGRCTDSPAPMRTHPITRCQVSDLASQSGAHKHGHRSRLEEPAEHAVQREGKLGHSRPVLGPCSHHAWPSTTGHSEAMSETPPAVEACGRRPK